MTDLSEARLIAVERQLTAIAQDTKEARDGVIRLQASLGEQNVPERLAEIKAEVKALYQEMRGDLVNSNARMGTRVDDLGKEWAGKHEALSIRVDKLEDKDKRTDGAYGVFQWLMKYAPVILSILSTLGVGTILWQRSQ